MKRFLAAAICLLLCFSLCGCSMFADTNELLATPELTGELYLVKQALKKSISGEYTLEYPSSGEKRSSVLLEDIDGDGQKEAFAFYSKSDKENKEMHLNLLVEYDKEYKSTLDFSITASGIEKIEFCDFNGDGKKEVVAGFEIYGNNEKTLVAFKMSSEKLSELMRCEYTGFLCGDLQNNGKNQLIVQKLTEKNKTNTASLYTLDGKTFSKVSSCTLDGSVTGVSKMVFSSLSNGNPAVYIDETKGIGAITEVLLISKGQLVNPILSTNNESGNLIRSAGIPFTDINDDSIIEIPVPYTDSNGYGGDVNYINWCSFNGENLTVKQTSFVNIIDGYSIVVPSRLVGKIKVTKNTEKRLRTVYYIDGTEAETDVAEKKIMTIRAVSGDDAEKLTGEVISVRNDEKFVVEYAEDLQETKLTKEQLKKMFQFNNF